MQQYMKGAQRTLVDGVELYRRRFYLGPKTLEKLDTQALAMSMTPSEYVAFLVNTAVTVPTTK